MSTATALLTPAERYAFDSFLTASVEPAEDEWQLYTQLGIPVPVPQQNPALAKATKDLISLQASTKRSLGESSEHPIATTSNHGAAVSLHRPIAPAPAPRPVQPHTQSSSAERPLKRARYSSSPPTSPPLAPGLAKPPLLTVQQKKANHIQSEQKRRANIRRGYDALCETIPALKEAIRAEEEAATVNGSANGKRRRTKEDGGEKVDGRAGPKSESVVLQKTIEHIQGLLQQQSVLLSRLERARAILGPDHPILMDGPVERLWEREWDGGKGTMVDIYGNEIKADGDESDEE